MLSERRCNTTVPAADLERAKGWYRDKLRLEPYEENDQGIWYRCGEGTVFALYPTQLAGTAQHTIMGWATDDLEGEMEELRARGVEFEEYDMPGLKTERGIADFGPYRGAWFKDADGNILLLHES